MANSFSKAQLSKLLRESAKLLRDPLLLTQLLNNATVLMEANKKKFSHLKADFDRALRAIAAYKKGDYQKLPVKSLLMIVASLIYFVNPLDLIPDFLFGMGYLDDLALVAYCFGIIRGDLKDFEEWEKSQEESEQTDSKS